MDAKVAGRDIMLLATHEAIMAYYEELFEPQIRVPG